jgi:hypothetical protein
MAVRDVVVPPRTSYAAGLFLLAAAVAFWPAYFSKLPEGDELYVDLHAAGVIGWMLLLIAQPLLILTGRRPLHRRLGAVSYGLAPYVVVSSLLLSHSRLDPVSAPTFRTDATDNYLALIAIALFATCYALAIGFRRRAPVHARFMTATLLTMVDPLVFRLLFFYTPLKVIAPQLPIFGYGLTDVILLGLAYADRNHPTARWVFPLLLAIFVPAHLGYWLLAPTGPWIQAMAWFKGLPFG